MKKFDVKENRPRLSKEDVERGMDFEKILGAAAPQARTFSLGRYLAVGIAAAIVVTLAIYWPELTGQSGETETSLALLPNTANPPDTFVVNTMQDTTLVYASGSRIRIPANAFVNKKGEPVKGHVKINYREFHKVSEILLANIPMRYDSAGKEMYFESAGMFDISAQQDSAPVFIARNKSLEVSLASLDKRDRKFNQYLLDEKTGKWQFIKPDEVKVVSRPDTIAAVTSRADSVRKTAPPKPVGERMFTIDATGRPELDVYKNIVFEVTPDCKTFDPQEAKTDWGMVNVEKLGRTDKYKVIFSYPLSGPLRSYEVTARPVKDGNMEALMQQYGDLYAAYKKKLAGAQQADQAAESALLQEQAMYQDVFERYRQLQEANARLYAAQAGMVSEVSHVVYRTFQVKEFGIWNSDCPSSMPQGVEVFANFEAAGGEHMKVAAVYLVEKGRNAMFNLYVPKKFSFNPDAENVLLVVTSNGKLGYVKNDVFEVIHKSTKNFTFKVTLLSKDKYSPGDIDDIVS
jgi:hypothetical protein